ncbi:MAG: mycothiol synthase [Actinomycetota bacterium]|jgi:mycothiol synthase|nr:mycothiol synthase [Actinomycetota bacterium]
MLNAVWAEELDADSRRRVRDFLSAVREADGKPEADGFSGGRHLLASQDGELVGYAHLDTDGDSFGRQVAELFVHPAYRRKGFGAAMVRRLPEENLRVWSHGDHPAAARLAGREGFSRARELLVLHTEADGWPEPVLREGVTLRTFEPGKDEQPVIDVNARAFDWHPEQGSLTVDELKATEDEAWFDPDGFFLAENADGKVVGFHWTKVHAANPKEFNGERVGEVYVVGVDPGAQGGGLGKALTLAGLRHLSGLGLRQFILYVEGDNVPALAVYEKLGFTRHQVDVQYAR